MDKHIGIIGILVMGVFAVVVFGGAILYSHHASEAQAEIAVACVESGGTWDGFTRSCTR